jgi:hypothetical protein
MKLVAEQGERAGQVLSMAQPALRIGRGKDNEIVLLEQDVSREHARLEREPQGWTLSDLGTTNGTFVNGKRLPAHEPYLLRPGDRITIGSSVLALQEDAPVGQAPPRGARRAPAALLLVAALAFVLLLVGIVALLVTVLKPKEAMATPTAINPGEQLLTVLPAPTEIQGIISTVVTGLPNLLEGTPPAGDAGEQLMTAVPVPTEMQGIVNTVVPELPDLFGRTPTP